MQTFLPSSNYIFASFALDSKRLNKQILECYQILKVLSENGKAWRNHPAVLMWEDHEGQLYNYAWEMLKEAHRRGIKIDKNMENLKSLKTKYENQWGWDKPEWLSDKEKINRVVATHRANLYRKDPIYYADYARAVDSPYNKPCCEKCNYFWPVLTHGIKMSECLKNNMI